MFQIPQGYKRFELPNDYNITQRKLENLQRLAEDRAYYDRNPVKLMEDIMGISLFDSQAYCVEAQWDTPFILWLCTRGYGKSTLGGAFVQAKQLVNNNFVVYIASGTGEQAIQTFTTLEKLATKGIASMPGLTGLFEKEVAVNNTTGNGFIHNPSGHYYELYNNSSTKTLNSNVDAKRGARANLLYFDETGFLTEEMISVYSAFTIVNSELKLGGNVDIKSVQALPRVIPNQLMFVSSASSVDTPFYQTYRDYAKRMILGDDRYFVAQIDCNVAIHPTVKGKIYPVSSLSQETVDQEMRKQKDKALREYYCRFDSAQNEGAIVKRADVIRNSITRPPLLYNKNGDKKIVLAYDPARSTDNSILSVGVLYEDPIKGWMMDVSNCVSFVDLGLKKKTPMMTQDQIREIRKLLLDYNGDAADYDSIEIFMADAGSGGGGNSWVRDSLIEDWQDKHGQTHPGLIDRGYSPEYARRYPNAINKLKLIEPAKHKSEMFEALIKMIEGGYITFTENYDGKGYLSILDVDQKAYQKNRKKLEEKYAKMELSIEELESKIAVDMDKMDLGKVKVYNLSPEEEAALGQIDLMKEELINAVRVKRDSGKDAFKISPEKNADTGGALHDDRLYTLAMLGWYLSLKRVEHIRKKKNTTGNQNLLNVLTFRKPKGISGLL